MGLGLKKGQVSVEEYDPEWENSFATEAKRLMKGLEGWITIVQHIGSTAIPFCEAKPILDIAAVVPSLSLTPDKLERLLQIGYGTGWIHILPDRICLTKGSPVTHHLYLVNDESITLACWLKFRDVLRNSATLRAEYVELKRRLAAEHRNNRFAYTKGKSEFVRQVLKSV